MKMNFLGTDGNPPTVRRTSIMGFIRSEQPFNLGVASWLWIGPCLFFLACVLLTKVNPTIATGMGVVSMVGLVFGPIFRQRQLSEYVDVRPIRLADFPHLSSKIEQLRLPAELQVAVITVPLADAFIRSGRITLTDEIIDRLSVSELGAVVQRLRVGSQSSLRIKQAIVCALGVVGWLIAERILLVIFWDGSAANDSWNVSENLSKWPILITMVLALERLERGNSLAGDERFVELGGDPMTLASSLQKCSSEGSASGRISRLHHPTASQQKS